LVDETIFTFVANVSLIKISDKTMIDLPKIKTQRLAVKLTAKAEKLVKQGHPWIFENSIVKVSKPGKSGDLAILFDNRSDKVFAIGLYDPDSPIRIKVLSNIPAQINKLFFDEKINTAYKLRRELLKTDTNSVKLYSMIWLPYLDSILPQLLNMSNTETMILRLSRNVAKSKNHSFKDGDVLHGVLKNEVVFFREHGVRFSANVIYGHKTGYFLDHRENRRRVGELSKEKTVLDVFSYAGGFSVHALAGGAREVTSLDISAQALKVAVQNGLLILASCSSRVTAQTFYDISEQNIIKTGRSFKLVDKTYHDIDHPVAFPEGAYLKCGYYKLN